MVLHFERSEFDARVAGARAALRREKLDAILLFAQESLYYLTGFDTSGFVFFQCAVLTAGLEDIVLLTRRPDLEQARRTSTITDVRLWYDGEGADPALELKAILEESKLAGARVAVEEGRMDAHASQASPRSATRLGRLRPLPACSRRARGTRG